jgi:acetyltransferase-like isoleucine patch superfamily enzyme
MRKEMNHRKSTISVFAMVRALYRRVQNSLELRKYTPNTIAEYFRKMGAQIGEDCFIVPTELSTEPYLIKIGNHVAIAAGVSFNTHDGAVWVFRDEVPDLQVFGPIIIEDNCIIGLRAIIFPNVRIGRNSVVAAGSVVINDVPPNSMVMGVPARPFGSLDKYRQKCLQRWAEQNPPDVIMADGDNWWNSQHSDANREQLRSHLLRLFHDQLGAENQIAEAACPNRSHMTVEQVAETKHPSPIS